MDMRNAPREIAQEKLQERMDKNDKIRASYDLLRRSDKYIPSFLEDQSLNKREFVDVIANRNFDGYSVSAGGGNTSAEKQIDRLYKNTPFKFVEEFLQNADDCRYESTPEVKIVIDEVRSTVEFTYNECGFSRADVWALTRFENSNKSDDEDRLLSVLEDGVYYKEKTGRKGIGFKSVFSLARISAADNVVVHICSNGFSFKLDHQVGAVIPIWEDTNICDNLTHITVELVNPKDSLKDIYPKFAELFGANDIERVFETNPLLFMHRIKQIRVEKIAAGTTDFFEVKINSTAKVEYQNEFAPEGVILSGIKNNGKFYQGATELQRLEYRGKSIAEASIDCIKTTYMVKCAGKYRNISFMAPVMREDEPQVWARGSLFRTFPLFDEAFSLPVAIDVPFELSDDRRDLEFADIRNARAFNLQLRAIVFGESKNNWSLLEQFYLSLRNIPSLRIDYYLPNQSVVLFTSLQNMGQNKERLIPTCDLQPILVSLPLLLPLEKGTGFVTLQKAKVADAQLFSWPYIELLLEKYSKTEKFVLVSGKYKGSKVVKRLDLSISSGTFAQNLTSYLDIVEKKLGIDSPAFFSFMENDVYKFLISQKEFQKKEQLWRKLPIYICWVKTDSGVQTQRCDGEGYKWRTAKNLKNNLSMAEFRTIESSPVDIDKIYRFIKGQNALNIQSLDVDFSSGALAARAKKCEHLGQALLFIESAKYYGYELQDITLPALKKYAVSDVYDSEVNLLREAGILKLISDEDLRKLSNYFDNDVETAVKELKNCGLRNGKELLSTSGDEVTFLKDTIRAMKANNGACAEKILDYIFSEIVKRGPGLKLKADYEQFKGVSAIAMRVAFKNIKNLTKDTETAISDGLLEDSRFIEDQSELVTELILRASYSSTKSHKEVDNRRISIEYVINNNIQSGVKKSAEKKPLKFTLYTKGSFHPITADDIGFSIHTMNAESIKNHDYSKTHFYKGKIEKEDKDIYYLSDSDAKNVFLSEDENGSYLKALSKFVDAPQDDDTMYQIEALYSDNIRDVCEQYIYPRWGNEAVTDDDVKETYGVEDKCTFIKVLSYFRHKSFDDVMGNASKNSEAEIIQDYKNDPWKFVYEFIQNVDDCSYEEDVDPSLSITIDKKRIVFDYNEKGFTADDIIALTRYGDSKKANSYDKNVKQDGIFDKERTGKLGRGFKSVFALPGDNIVVHIQSNGYSFFFHKRIGAIVPIWEESTDTVIHGTKITIEGLPSNILDEVFNKLSGILSIKKPDEIFAKCPVLYLRKLRLISISNEKKQYQIGVTTDSVEISPTPYEVDFRSTEIIAGIKEGTMFRDSAFSKGTVYYSVNGNVDIIPIIKYTIMVQINNATRTLSVTAPTHLPVNSITWRGGFYHTLPIDNVAYSIPVAINGPFVLDSGRQNLASEQSDINNQLIELVSRTLLPGFYNKLRNENVQIDQYIPIKNEILFANNEYLPNLNLQQDIKSYPILELQSGNGFVSVKEARCFTNDIYEWPCTEYLAECVVGKDVLAHCKYMGQRLNISKIDLIRKDFVDIVNAYLNHLCENGINVWDVINTNIMPFIDEHYDEIDNLFYNAYKDGKNAEVRKLCIFGFTMSDGEIIRSDATGSKVWVKDVPDRNAKSFGKIRLLANAPVLYTDKALRFIEKIRPVINYTKAFTSDSIHAKDIKTWDKAKELVATLVYYKAPNTFEIPFLRKCVFDDKIDDTPNLLRDAYKETHNDELIAYYIKNEDLLAIQKMPSEIVCTLQDIVAALKRFGLKVTDDLFDMDSNTVALSKTTIKLLNVYCTDRCKSKKTVSRLEKALQDIQLDRHFVLNYEDLKNCSAYVFAAIFEAKGFKKAGEAVARLARNYINEAKFSQTEIFAESVLAALPYAKQCDRELNISLSLSSIITQKIGSVVQKGMLASKKLDKFKFNIILNSQGTPYESRAVNKAIEWMGNENENEAYTYYIADIQDAFTTSENNYLLDSEKVILPVDQADSNLYSFVEAWYASDEGRFKGVLEVVVEQKRLQEKWNRTKQEYIISLAKFREKTYRLEDVLFPNLQKNINNATGNAVDYIVPELLQNINDCQPYSKDEERMLSIQIQREKGMMSLTYDERGFDYKDIYSITALGQSTKFDEREGEKGVGFKKVFALFDWVEIHSNDFHFKLTEEKRTIPQWVNTDQPKNAQGKTTMVFHTYQREVLEKIVLQWQTLMTAPYYVESATASPIFLDNILKYEFTVDDKLVRTLARKEVQNCFYSIKLPLVKTFKKLAAQSECENSLECEEKNFIADLRTRTKCKVMTDTEFNEYVEKLTISVLIPRKVHTIKGRFFSTLPTKQSTFTELFINLPLELSTGRDEILAKSDFNRRIFEMVFGMQFADKSVINYILERFAMDHPDIEIFRYLAGHEQEYIQMIEEKTGCPMEDQKQAFDGLKIFHAYPSDKIVSLNPSFSLPSIIYSYIYSGSEIRNNIRVWLDHGDYNCQDYYLIDIKTDIQRTCRELEKFCQRMEIQPDRYPINSSLEIVSNYFKDEYALSKESAQES